MTASGVAVDAAGRIVLSGTYLAGYELCPDGRTNRAQRVAFLARLGDSGQPDFGFGDSGVVTLREGPVGARTRALSRYLLMAPGDKPLLLGPVKSPLTSSEGLALARYLPSG